MRNVHWIAMRVAAFVALATAIAVEARATTYSEPPDLADSFAARTFLPIGTDLVFAGVSVTDTGVGPVIFRPDFFAFTGLAPGAPYSITMSIVSTNAVLFFELLDSSASVLDAFQLNQVSPPQTRTGNVPLDGQLVVRAFVGDSGANYSVALNAPLVPEPSTGLLLGAGLAALGASRRRV